MNLQHATSTLLTLCIYQNHHRLNINLIIHIPTAMSNAEARSGLTKIMIEKALWNCCVSLSLTEIMPNLYLGG